MNKPPLPILFLTVFTAVALSGPKLCATEPATPRAAGATNAAPEHVHALPTNAIAAAKAAGYPFTGFDTLAGFPAELQLTITGPELTGKIPDAVLGLTGKPAAIAGFMQPQKMRAGRVTEFLLLKETSKCCQSGPPKMNEWVIVRTNTDGVEAVTDRMIVVAGELTVGEYREHGRLRAIYRMDAEKIFGPEVPATR
jgi:hypothetical protein